MIGFAAAAVLLALSVAPTGPASAAGPEDQLRSIKISYADLDLTTAQGRTVLDGRLRKAARKVCHVIPAEGQVEYWATYACRRRAFLTARGQAKLAATRVEVRLAQGGQIVVAQ